MNSKQRMLTAMLNRQPDRVPVSPDMSNMIPCKLTGKPFWDIYLYKDPPLWKAYIDAVKYFGFDGWLADDANVNAVFDEIDCLADENKTFIVFQNEEKIITRRCCHSNGKKTWSPLATVYLRYDPPTITAAKNLDIPEIPETAVAITGIQQQKSGLELLREVNEYMGERGVVGMFVSVPILGRPEIDPYCIYDYIDHPEKVRQWAQEQHNKAIEQLNRIIDSPVKPDFILTGGSGMLIFNTPKIIKELTLPTLQELSRICKKANIPTQIHCCGPERELIRMCAEETDINNMNPLEIPPMGDCNLAEIKRQFGHKISLMGNIHTTSIMLHGSVEQVKTACKKALDDAAEGGGFILSTGDQCGRDTPEENIFAMIETAKTYGKY